MTKMNRSFKARGGAAGGPRARGGEGGYALVALLALMTLLALAMLAAAPNVRQQKQRELEREAIARGEEVAEAIRQYVRRRNTLPTSMDQLLEGAPFGIKKIQILRPSAARDPLSSSGEWRLIPPGSAALIEFQKDVTLYGGGRTPATRDTALQQFAARLLSVTSLGQKDEATGGGEDDSFTTSGPFIGVASRSRRESVLTYYGIERHDKWVFTPLFR